MNLAIISLINKYTLKVSLQKTNGHRVCRRSIKLITVFDKIVTQSISIPNKFVVYDFHASVLFDQSVYVLGGMHASAHRKFLRINMQSNQTEKLTSCNLDRTFHSMT